MDNPIDNLCYSRKTGNGKYAHFDLSSEIGAHDSKRFESSSVHEVVAGSETSHPVWTSKGKHRGTKKKIRTQHSGKCGQPETNGRSGQGK
jgi:hypothetical protein